MNLWHAILSAFLAVLMTGSISNCFMTPQERSVQEAMESLLSESEPIPPEDPDATYWFTDIREIPDEPVWEISPVDPVEIRIADISEIDIPNPDEWTCFVNNKFPIYLGEEDGELVLRGLHVKTYPILSYLGNNGELDGLQRWVIGDERSDVFKFDVEYRIIARVCGVNNPENPGPEFILYRYLEPDVKGESGRLIERAEPDVMLFNQTGQCMATVAFTEEKIYWGFISGFPLEFNDTSKVMMDLYGQNEFRIEGKNGENITVRDYYMLDLTGDTAVYLDPRSGNPDAPLYPGTWLVSTGEFIYSGGHDEPGAFALSVMSEDLSTVSTHTNEWPCYPDDDYYLWENPLRPFFFKGDRYFIFYGTYTGHYSHPEAPMIVWCLKYNEGDDEMVPVWCRYTENMPNVTYEILYLGDEARPYLVQFSNITEKLLVTDLPSGQLMIDTKLDLTNFKETDTRPYHVIRLDQYNDIPVVVIFDKTAGHIVKINLELVEP